MGECASQKDVLICIFFSPNAAAFQIRLQKIIRKEEIEYRWLGGLGGSACLYKNQDTMMTVNMLTFTRYIYISTFTMITVNMFLQILISSNFSAQVIKMSEENPYTFQ